MDCAPMNALRPVDAGGPTLVHEYVVGTITTKDDRLRFYHRGSCVKTIAYKVSKGPLLSHM